MVAQDLLGAVVSEIVMPALSELDQEANQSILAKVSVMFSGTVVAREICTRVTDTDDGVRGEVKVLLKNGTMPGVFNFSIECVIEGLAPGTGFSGFVMRGKLTTTENSFSVKVAGRTNRYNVWNWGKISVLGPTHRCK